MLHDVLFLSMVSPWPMPEAFRGGKVSGSSENENSKILDL